MIVVAVLAMMRRNCTWPSGAMTCIIRPTRPPYSVVKLAVGSVMVLLVAETTGGLTGLSGIEWPRRVMISPSASTKSTRPKSPKIESCAGAAGDAVIAFFTEGGDAQRRAGGVDRVIARLAADGDVAVLCRVDLGVDDVVAGAEVEHRERVEVAAAHGRVAFGVGGVVDVDRVVAVAEVDRQHFHVAVGDAARLHAGADDDVRAHAQAEDAAVAIEAIHAEFAAIGRVAAAAAQLRERQLLDLRIGRIRNRRDHATGDPYPGRR